jgi:mycoredoxin
MPTSTVSIPRFTLFTTTWCPQCFQAKAWLKQHGLEPGRDFDEIDIEVDTDAAATVEQLTGGYRSVPTFQLSDGTVFSEPSPAELAAHFS